MLARTAFYPTLLYNVVLEKAGVRQWFNRIDDTVLLGALPFKSTVNHLIEEENVKGIVTLNEDFELRNFVYSTEELKSLGIEQLHIPTTDITGAPKLSQLQQGVQFIDSHRVNGNSVYVHCKAGRTRSTTVVACYLMKLHGWSPEESLTYIKERRPHIILRSSQRKALHDYYTHLQPHR